MNPAQKRSGTRKPSRRPFTLDHCRRCRRLALPLVRAFASATGLSVMRYVRARRLSNAAQALAAGAPDILNLALDADYSSHEAFTRAFRDHSASRPRRSAPQRASRTQASGADRHGFTLLDNLKPPRFEPPSHCSAPGIAERCTHENEGAGIPNLWHQFHQKVDGTPGADGNVAYGVCCNGDDAGNFDYVAGVEVADFSDLPREFARVRIPDRNTPSSPTPSTSSTIRRTVNTIWNHWLPYPA